MKKNNIDFKVENKPRTVLEKYERLKKINPDIDLLKRTFNLDIQL